MKKLTLLAAAVCILGYGKAQIPNANFERWTSRTQDVPDKWQTLGLTSKVSPGASGNYAVKVQGNPQVTKEPGAILYGNPNGNGFQGGTPFTARPDSLIAYFKYKIVPGDSAWVLIIFKKAGQTIGMDQYKYAGTDTTAFRRKAFKIHFFTSGNPDTVFLGFTSTSADKNPNKNSYVIVDNISFTGTTQNVPNPSFENWTTKTDETLDGWYFRKGTVPPAERTTDAVSGNYAVKVVTTITSGDTTRGEISTPRPGQNPGDWGPSFPLIGKPDSLIFFAKYFPQKSDTGSVIVNLFKKGLYVGSTQVSVRGTISSYRRLAGKINYTGSLTGNPDSAMITISTFAQTTFNPRPRGNSVLYIDKLSFDRATKDVKGCAGQGTAFTSSRRLSGSNDSIVSFTWDFGDGSATSSQQNPVHVYASPGVYEVGLKVTTDKGGSDYSVRIAQIYRSPGGAFISNTVCEGNLSKFSAVDSSAGNTYAWDFGDGGSASGLSVTHAYKKGGAYAAKLTVTNAAGCSTSTNKSVIVNTRAKVSFTFADACAGSTVNFTNSSSANGDSITSYVWDFGDGASSSDKNPSHKYVATGSYAVKLVAHTLKNCDGTRVDTLVIFPMPQPAFTASNTCLGDSMLFTDASTPSGSIASWHWKFGDGAISTAQNPSHTYPSAGTYRVTLTVTTSGGCTDSVSKTVAVLENPKATFSFTRKGLTLEVKADDTTLTAYDWSFGDGGTGNGFKNTHTYSAEGNYPLSLITKNANGCHATALDSIHMTMSDIQTLGGEPVSLKIFPNPFRGSTTLEYELQNSSMVKVVIYSSQGGQAVVLLESTQSSGRHAIVFNPNIYRMKPGPYFVELWLNGSRTVRQIIRVE